MSFDEGSGGDMWQVVAESEVAKERAEDERIIEATRQYYVGAAIGAIPVVGQIAAIMAFKNRRSPQANPDRALGILSTSITEALIAAFLIFSH